ncbi:MAG: glycosyltransferase family 2 protein [Clostridiales bacterium]|jgi:glycosyltransferase involved in cell wall biosynthesis|nr:glycosyltransferase family 2 protein [Clostridiales bacterium]
MQHKPLVSIVCPCYNEEAMLPLYYEAMQKRVLTPLAEYDFELILINDGSKDGTLPVLRALAQQDERVKYLSFSRNFGKEAAMYAGLKNAKGDFVCVMDCDLQDPPEMIANMLERLGKEDCDCVATRRVTRKGEPKIRSAFARAFYRVINRISDTEFVDGARDFRMMRRCVADAVLELGEYHRFSKGIFMWVGFDTVWLEYENVERAAGETKWSFWKLARYAIEGIVSFSTAPLRIATAVGSIVSALALIYMVIRVVIAMIWGNPVAGYPSLLAITLCLGGFILLALGIIGEYVARTYMQVKQRPIYIQKETNIR